MILPGIHAPPEPRGTVQNFWGLFGPGAVRSDFSKISSVPGFDGDFTVGFRHVFEGAYDTYIVLKSLTVMVK